MLRRFIKHGWRVVTEIHTAQWVIVDVMGAFLPASVLTVAISWLGEHSVAVLATAFVITFAAASLVLLAYLGRRAERRQSTQDGPRREPIFEQQRMVGFGSQTLFSTSANQLAIRTGLSVSLI